MVSSYSGGDRRRHPRYPVTLKICYTCLDTFFYDYAVNISKGGVYIRTNSPLGMGSRVKLSFTLPGLEHTIETAGVVVRVVEGESDFEPCGMAVEFDSLSAEDVELINRLWEESTQP